MVEYSIMYNWSSDLKKVNKKSERFAIWSLEQGINFGLGREKLEEAKLRKYWDKLDLDPKRKMFLEFLLWGIQS